ncbi:MAG: 4-hydroxy-tetrahydrodipicolinate synthase [Parcubacteria group bacterium]|nr:4-hydroxy-tetrahydrodipicolinate synthase [Parcubacteria group bacterium]|tara:strand:+ start:2735 stop:3802 length:1068 start_codon:yes stop_codon:yes gene_type:complete
MICNGAVTALIGPLNLEGKEDCKQLERNVEFQMAQGVTGVLSLGTTFCSPTVDPGMHIKLNRLVAEITSKQIQAWAGAGSNSTLEAMEMATAAARDGADVVLLVDCYYNKPASIQLRDQYHSPIAGTLADAYPDVGYVVYAIPGRTNCQLMPVDLAILAEQWPNVIGVKEATGSLSNMQETRRFVNMIDGRQFSIMSGDDSITGSMMTDPLINGNGVVSVISNIAPAAVAKMVAAFQSGDSQTGQKLAGQLKPLFGLVGVSVQREVEFHGQKVMVEDKFPNPCPIQTMMAGLGMDTGFLRMPLGKMSVSAVDRVCGALNIVWTESPEILQPIEEFYEVDIAKRLMDHRIWSELCA